MSRLVISRVSRIATAEEQADAYRGDAVVDAVAGRHAQPDPEQCEDQADQRAAVFEQEDRQFGGSGSADERHPVAAAAGVVGLPDRGPR